MKEKYYLIILAMLLQMSIGPGSSQAAVGGHTVGGCIYTGHGNVSYTLNTAGEPVASYTTSFAPSPETPEISNAQVMIQNQEGGAVLGYGTMGLEQIDLISGLPIPGTDNCWEYTVPDADTNGIPDAEDVIVMYAAPGHNATSREFTWNSSLGQFTHPKQGGGVVGLVDDVLGGLPNPGASEATGSQDAYLPPLENVDPATGGGTTETANLLHYVFYDHFTNGGDNGPIIDPPLNGVTVSVLDMDGNVVQTQRSGELAFSQGGFVTKDGLPFYGSTAYGFVYFQGLPGNQTYEVISDPSTVTQADNPHFTLSLPHSGAENCSLDRNVAGPYGYGNGDCPWYQVSTEEGGHSWEAFLWPGDPGTEMGFYLTWHGFIEKIGNPPPGNPLAGTFSGLLVDADGNDPDEPIPQENGGRVPPTNARYEDGTPWNVNLGSAGWGDCGGAPCPPIVLDFLPNGRIPDAILALYSTGGGIPRLVATTEATQPSLYNSQDGGTFLFENIPPGTYEVITFDKDLVNVPRIGTAITINPGQNAAMSIMNPRFNARVAGFVLSNNNPVDAVVKAQFGGGQTQRMMNTNPATGWFEVFDLPETGGLGKFYVDLQDGGNYRGKLMTETFQRIGVDPTTGLDTMIYNDVTHNSMSRSVQWWTLNYFADLQLEAIPSTVGNLIGAVFHDNLSTGAGTADGIWNEEHETLNAGETIELHAALGDATVGFSCPSDATGLTPLATTVTGDTNEEDAQIMGWWPFGTFPPQEIGSVHADPVVCPECSQTVVNAPGPVAFSPLPPAYGMYEFRDVVPGTYCVRVAPKDGYRHSPDSVTGLHLVTVTGGLNSRVDMGVSTTPAAKLGGIFGDGIGACNAADPINEPGILTCDNNRDIACIADADCENIPSPQGGVPLAALIEGGVFSGNGDLDPNPLSTMFDEASNMVGSPVAVRDQNNYLLGVMYQTDAWCNTANNAVHAPGSYPTDPWACSSAVDIIQPPEMDRYFASGIFRYSGNDPFFTKDPAIALPDATGLAFAGNDKTQGFDPRFETMELGAGAFQAGFLLEFAWTPLTPIDGSVSADMCAIGLEGVSFTSEPWGGNITITVSDGYTPLQGATVSGSVNGEGGEDCFTDQFGRCTMSFEKFEGAGDSVQFVIDSIQADAWYQYNPTPGGILAGACQTEVTLWDPNLQPPPPGDPAACGDGVDNDGDGLIDFGADPGCISLIDDDEFNDALPTYQCSDGIDNDGDTLIDFPADPGCTSATGVTEVDVPPPPVFACSDGIDNDGDGLIDMADLGCDTINDDDETDPITACTDGIDNDGDTLIDLADPGCISANDNDEYNAPLPVCSDLIDNDGDGLVDMADPGCLSPSDTDETDPLNACSDGVDNDGDGLTDFPADPGCISDIDNDEADPITACNDGLDNDGDTLIDFPADPGCTSSVDTDEYNAPLPICSDFIDNDGDGLIDFPADPGCLSASDTDETDIVYLCSDGIDNDGDGLIDYPADLGCVSAVDQDETDPLVQCNDGIDNDGDGLIDFGTALGINDPGCASSVDDNEFNGPLPACSDWIDNDGDGLIDFPADPGCMSAEDLDEVDPMPACSDGIDNDGDGLVDFPVDPGCSSTIDDDEFNAIPECSDGIDNDGDGFIDFPVDTGCDSMVDNDERSACQDGIDNDGDGFIDFPDDEGCFAPTHTSEVNPPLACVDGIDNDGDGLIDMEDPGCTSEGDADETDPIGACNDGLDNDGDGLIDYPADPGCTGPVDIDEYNAPLPHCDDGIDNDGDGLIDMADAGCSNATDNDETDPVFACSDGLDNDGDTLIDFPADPGCTDALDNDEYNAPPKQCSDGIDNDGDGLIDMADAGCSSATDDDETDVATSVHVASLNSQARYREGKLRAAVTAEVVNNLGAPVSGANVSMNFTWYPEGKEKTGTMSCNTNASGTCTANTKWLEKTSSVEVNLNTVSAQLPYFPQDNTATSPITVP